MFAASVYSTQIRLAIISKFCPTPVIRMSCKTLSLFVAICCHLDTSYQVRGTRCQSGDDEAADALLPYAITTWSWWQPSHASSKRRGTRPVLPRSRTCLARSSCALLPAAEFLGGTRASAQCSVHGQAHPYPQADLDVRVSDGGSFCPRGHQTDDVVKNRPLTKYWFE